MPVGRQGELNDVHITFVLDGCGVLSRSFELEDFATKPIMLNNIRAEPKKKSINHEDAKDTKK